MQCFDVTPAPPPDPHFWQDPAFWAWVVILAAVLGFDLTQLHRHGHTMSQFLQHFSAHHPWFKWVVLDICGIAGIHFGWGL